MISMQIDEHGFVATVETDEEYTALKSLFRRTTRSIPDGIAGAVDLSIKRVKPDFCDLETRWGKLRSHINTFRSKPEVKQPTIELKISFK